ncbi:MAG: hypothetical protein N4A46_10935 [Schleiferiaceae bacterium]|jgi:ComF family protein|nr:hypothetical protein [Schleiferiaceae bacterium]
MNTLTESINLKSWLTSLANLIFPQECPGCKNPLLSDELWLCLECELKLPIAPYLLHNENPITALVKGRLKIEFGTSFMIFTKDGLAQNLIHHLKYSGRTDIGEKLGVMFAKRLIGKVQTPDAILPVPLHPNKEKIRGYNQSWHIAKGMCKVFDIPIADSIVERIKENPSQTKLSRYNRWENVKDIFTSTRKHTYEYIWIVDDTLTTGSTLEACAMALLKNREIKIGIATLAYAD